jgi:hypothetical protein
MAIWRSEFAQMGGHPILAIATLFYDHYNLAQLFKADRKLSVPQH